MQILRAVFSHQGTAVVSGTNPEDTDRRIEIESEHLSAEAEEAIIMIYCFLLVDTPMCISSVILIITNPEQFSADILSLLCFGCMFLHIGLYSTAFHEMIKVSREQQFINSLKIRRGDDGIMDSFE